MRIDEHARVHFVGIGGAGMSAIAKVLLERGAHISGSDLKLSRAAATLQAMGADVRVGHDASLVEGRDLVVVSAAIPERNPELAAARAAGLPVMTRGEALAAVLEGSRSIVVAGTHGKTTTTSMIVSILRSAGVDATYLVGGGLNDSGTNAKHGRSDVSVAESDESDGSFLLLEPHVAVITNIEVDHVDHWKDAEELREAFRTFTRAVDPAGAVVLPMDDDVVEGVARATGARVLHFGTGGEIEATDVDLGSDSSRFVLRCNGSTAQVHLSVPGSHNVANATAAAAAAFAIGIDVEAVAQGLTRFRGVERRFQMKGRVGGVTVVDDYAHHPTEIAATLEAARRGAWDRVIAVFQPHRFSRTAAFHREFGEALALADRIVVTDVYGAGEEPVPGVTGKLISDAVCDRVPGRTVAYLPHRGELLAYLWSSARPGDLLLTLGAGDVTSVGDEILARLGASA